MNIQLWPSTESTLILDFLDDLHIPYLRHSWRALDSLVKHNFTAKCSKCDCLKRVDRKGTEHVTIYKLGSKDKTSTRPNCTH